MNHTDTTTITTDDIAVAASSPKLRRVARTTLSLGVLAGAAWLTAAPWVWMF